MIGLSRSDIEHRVRRNVNRAWHPLRHRLATAATDLVRETLRWAYVGPEDQDRLGFVSFGERTLIEAPYKVLIGHEYMSIGSDTLIAAGAILAAWPDSTDARRVDDRPVLRIGDRVWGARGLSIVAHLDIEIADDVWFGPNVYVTDAGHDPSDLDKPIGLAMEPAEPVRIGAGSWIGTGAVILPGVTIGEHVVIGANAVVTNDIPSFCVAVGSPARVVKDLREETE
ncbi:MAG: acyltransferase [Microthrixaceae bacterium]